MNLKENIRRILREETRFNKMGEERYKSCSMSDITRMEIIDNFLKEVETNPKYNEEEPNYDMLLDDWDGYDDQVYIQNQLDEGRIIFYEGWVDSCWSAVYKKPQYEGMDEEEVIDSIITKRFPRIAEEFNMIIDDYGYFNNGDGYIMYIVLKESNTNLQESIRRILREETQTPLFIRRRFTQEELDKLVNDVNDEINNEINYDIDDIIYDKVRRLIGSKSSQIGLEQHSEDSDFWLLYIKYERSLFDYVKDRLSIE